MQDSVPVGLGRILSFTRRAGLGRSAACSGAQSLRIPGVARFARARRVALYPCPTSLVTAHQTARRAKISLKYYIILLSIRYFYLLLH